MPSKLCRPGGVRPRWLACVDVAVALVAACSSSGGTNAKVKAAAKHVSDAQTALSDAQSNLAAKSTGFCKASQSYITALDGYGDVLKEEGGAGEGLVGCVGPAG